MVMAVSPDEPTPGRQARRASLPAEAETLVAEVYLPHRLDLPRGVASVDLELLTTRIGSLTVGQVSYGRSLAVHTEVTEDVYVVFVLRGRVEMRIGTGRPHVLDVGAGAVFPVGVTGHGTISKDCVVMVIMVSPARLEAELEHLLGQALTRPLELGFEVDLHTPLGKTWEPLLRLLVQELRQPTALTQHPAAARRVEGVVLDALLLGHDHNYRELLDRAAVTAGRLTAVGRAIQLVEADPTQLWTTARLASEVHLSVRALQARFRQEAQVSPMDYVRRARLRGVHTALVEGTPQTTTVRALAQRYRFAHLGRFASTYREIFGESPGETLRRPPLA
jgi:AraC-like DNA-binding protein